MLILYYKQQRTCWGFHFGAFSGGWIGEGLWGQLAVKQWSNEEITRFDLRVMVIELAERDLTGAWAAQSVK